MNWLEIQSHRSYERVGFTLGNDRMPDAIDHVVSAVEAPKEAEFPERIGLQRWLGSRVTRLQNGCYLQPSSGFNHRGIGVIQIGQLQLRKWNWRVEAVIQVPCEIAVDGEALILAFAARALDRWRRA